MNKFEYETESIYLTVDPMERVISPVGSKIIGGLI